MASWTDPKRWDALRDGSACWTCVEGPAGIVVGESATVWVTTDHDVACRGYVRLYAKRHVVELFELDADERSAFFLAVGAVAAAIDELFRPAKLNYEIHGNTNPHLHLHLFPRYIGDRFEGGPIVGSYRGVRHSDEDITAISNAVQSGLI